LWEGYGCLVGTHSSRATIRLTKALIDHPRRIRRDFWNRRSFNTSARLRIDYLDTIRFERRWHLVTYASSSELFCTVELGFLLFIFTFRRPIFNFGLLWPRLGAAGNAASANTTNNYNHTINTNSATVTSNFKRQNTIDSATIKENTVRLNARPVKNTANLTNPSAVPLDSSSYSFPLTLRFAFVSLGTSNTFFVTSIYLQIFRVLLSREE